MCGIVGIVHRNRDIHVDAGAIRTMCDAIQHRGPDDQGVWVDGPVGLGMRRLSIIDLVGGRQPIFNEDRSKVIVFNGEIYNYRELRRGLVQRGHRFASDGDTEAILHLYEEAGADVVSHLRGMFGFALWDSASRSLLLARDRFGIKPLYYVAADWGIAFSSELKALCAIGATDRTLDWDALDAYFQLGYIPAPASPFRDVRKLEPGHHLTWRESGEITIERYYDLPEESADVPSGIEQRVLEQLDESVAAHMISDVPVAAFLSGGLDSSAVVASMALANPGAPPHVFTARYSGSGSAAADESALATQLAHRYGAKLSVVEIAPQVRDVIEPIVRALDEPHADDSAIPTWTLSEIVGASYKVALTGIGGDELFAGYRRHAGLARAERFTRLPLALRRGIARSAQLIPDVGGGLHVDRLKRFARATGNGHDSADIYLAMISRMADGERASLYAPEVGRSILGKAAHARFRTLRAQRGLPRGVDAALYFDYHTYLPDDILALSDRLSMAHSLEIRVPFVDHRLVDALYPLPAAMKASGAPKQLLRRALADRLPAGHMTAPKRGFVGPTSAWLRNELRPMIEDELSAARMSRLGLLSESAVSGLLRDHFGHRHNREAILWALLCFSTWHRLYVESAAVPRYAPHRRAAAFAVPAWATSTCA
ncbi:MAG TPA: asparagine synthase (glutamine-hydrolyzing) [Gemmatimonadaceae bacterium]|jgi:asparagine synthase (glutamine-hydrolysing)